MSEFFIAGIAMTGLGKFVDRSVKSREVSLLGGKCVYWLGVE